MEKLFKKTGTTFILKIIGLGLSFFLQILFARLLTPEIYGKYTLIITYTNIFCLLIVLGMDQNLIKEIGKKDKKNKDNLEYLYYVTKLSSIIFILFMIIIIVTNKYISVSSEIIIYFLVILAIKSIIRVLDGFLQGIGLITKVTFLNIFLNNLFKIIVFIFLYKVGINRLESAIISFIIGELLCILIRIKFIYHLYEKLPNSFENINMKEKKKFVKYSLSLVLISGIGLLMKNIDKVMIGYFIGNKSVGMYKVVQNYVSLISVFVTPFIAFWPQISKLYSENKIKEIERNMKMIVKVIIFFVIPMFFIFYYKGNEMLLVFGEDYLNDYSKKILLILGFSFLIDAISGPIASILTMTNYAKYVLYNNIISLTVNIILNYILLLKYGVVGIALGTGISIILNNILSIIQVKDKLDIFSYDFKTLINIIFLLPVNFLTGKMILEKVPEINIYLDIVLFTLIIYSLNFILVGLIFRKKIKLIFKTLRR